MIRLTAENQCLALRAAADDLASRHENQLAYWGFSVDRTTECWSFCDNDQMSVLEKVSKYFDAQCIRYELDDSLAFQLAERRHLQIVLRESRSQGTDVKEGTIDERQAMELQQFLHDNIPRRLKDHQYKSALHLLAVRNGANFSVPGSGKTTVVLVAFELLRAKGLVDALFVVGPPACFGPWQHEFEKVLGRQANCVTLAGGSIEERRIHYVADRSSVLDLYLTSFQTLARDYQQVQTLFKIQGIRFFLVVDEAHYIKQLGGTWAEVVLGVAPYAARRCVLTGTPFPKSYTDAFNLFDVLWPEAPALSANDKRKISVLAESQEFDQASIVLNESIGPLFYRVRKSELGLERQVFLDPIIVPMKLHERTVYDAILERIDVLSSNDYWRDLELLSRLRCGRMMRLRQCLSYTKLLLTALPNYDEDLIHDDQSLVTLIQSYDELETPGKLDRLGELVDELQERNEKVVIWSNFVKSLHLIHRHLTKRGYCSRLIYGETPLESDANEKEALTRERIIREFVNKNSGVDVLVANPAACAESISLHKTCSNAIYYDLSYNCAQYLQSLDRIHRVGGSERKRSYYYFLQYERTLDQDILQNLRSKAERMSHIIDQDYPIYSLDMFESDLSDDEHAYARFFSHETKHIS